MGPHANSTRALLGNYFDQACPPTAAKPGTPGTPSNFDCIQTPASAIAAASGTTPTVVTGCVDIHCTTLAPAVMAAVEAAVEAADVVVVMGGFDWCVVTSIKRYSGNTVMANGVQRIPG